MRTLLTFYLTGANFETKLEEGFDIVASPLGLSIKNDHTSIAIILLKKIPELNVLSFNSESLLSMAAKNGNHSTNCPDLMKYVKYDISI